MTRVAFGGSFNPPTIAHYEIIKKLSELYDEVIIVPNGKGYTRKSINDVNIIVEMLNLIKEDFNNVIVSDLELKRSFKGTINTLRDLKHPTFACGDDCLFDFRTWMNAEEFLKENKFLIFTRNHNLDLIKEKIKNDSFLSKFIDNFQFIKIDYPDISSTKFINTLNFNLLPPKVATFIHNNNLYQEEN